MVVDLEVAEHVDVDALERRQQIAQLREPQAVTAAPEDRVAGRGAEVVGLQA